MWSLHIFVLGPKKVPPTYFILCSIQFTFSMCSKINCLIPGFFSNTSKVPSGFSYLVVGPLMGMSSMYSNVYLGISLHRIYITSSWNIGTEFVHPIGNVTNLKALKGIWNVVRSLEHSASTLSLYLTYKSNIPLHTLPVKCITNSSVAGGNPECMIVTLFKGSRLCMMRKLFLFFLITQNHLERYELFEDSYTPASILLLIIPQTSSCIAGSILNGLSTHSICVKTLDLTVEYVFQLEAYI